MTYSYDKPNTYRVTYTTFFNETRVNTFLTDSDAMMHAAMLRRRGYRNVRIEPMLF